MELLQFLPFALIIFPNIQNWELVGWRLSFCWHKQCWFLLIMPFYRFCFPMVYLRWRQYCQTTVWIQSIQKQGFTLFPPSHNNNKNITDNPNDPNQTYQAGYSATFNNWNQQYLKWNTTVHHNKISSYSFAPSKVLFNQT